MRALHLALCLAIGLALCSCPGSVIQPLPAGSGPGVYSGQLEGEDGNGNFTRIGDLQLTVDNAGQVTGTGQLLGGAVQITGLLGTDGRLDGTIIDTLDQYSGRFDGQLAANQLAGDFRLPRPDRDDITGDWDAQLQ